MMFEDVLTLIVGYIGDAFEKMDQLTLLAGISLFDFLVILLILEVVIMIFIPTPGDFHGDLVASSRRESARAERAERFNIARRRGR